MTITDPDSFGVEAGDRLAIDGVPFLSGLQFSGIYLYLFDESMTP